MLELFTLLALGAVALLIFGVFAAVAFALKVVFKIALLPLWIGLAAVKFVLVAIGLILGLVLVPVGIVLAMVALLLAIPVLLVAGFFGVGWLAFA